MGHFLREFSFTKRSHLITFIVETFYASASATIRLLKYSKKVWKEHHDGEKNNYDDDENCQKVTDLEWSLALWPWPSWRICINIKHCLLFACQSYQRATAECINGACAWPNSSDAMFRTGLIWRIIWLFSRLSLCETFIRNPLLTVDFDSLVYYQSILNGYVNLNWDSISGSSFACQPAQRRLKRIGGVLIPSITIQSIVIVVSIYAADMQQVKLWHSRLSQPMILQKGIQYLSAEVNLRSAYS